MRMIQIQDNISEQKNLKDKLESEQEKLHEEYNKVSIPIQTHRQSGSCLWTGWFIKCASKIIRQKFKHK